MENQPDIKISIPKPCHEDWNKMTPNEKGAFCMKCAKTVVDFTKKTTDEIKDFLIEQSGKKICGRFMSDQIDQPKKLIRIEVPVHLIPKRLSFNKVFAFALFITFGTTLFSCSTTQGEIVGEISPVIDTAISQSSVPEPMRITGDTVYNIIEQSEKLKSPKKIKQNCTPLQGDVMIEPIENVKGEVMALPIDTVKAEPDTGPMKVGKLKINE